MGLGLWCVAVEVLEYRRFVVVRLFKRTGIVLRFLKERHFNWLYNWSLIGVLNGCYIVGEPKRMIHAEDV